MQNFHVKLPFYQILFTLSSHGLSTQAQLLSATAEEDKQSEGVDSDHFSGSNSSFLANEKLMSVDSMNSDITGITFILQFLNDNNNAWFKHECV